MQRYFISLAYDGAPYHGWQKQPNANSVQSEIENVLSSLHGNSEIQITGCGRTDTGVHAHHYVFHVDLPEITDLEVFKFKLNRMLRDSIAVFEVFPVSQDMHARFSAKSRTYRYFIHHTKDPFLSDRSWYLPQKPNIDAMNQAANHLLGKHDFTSFSKLHTDVKTNFCEVRFAQWIRVDDDAHYFEITADRFLRNMVRATVGTLLDVGAGKISVEEFQTVLQAKDRQAASVSVPAHGLFLWDVVY